MENLKPFIGVIQCLYQGLVRLDYYVIEFCYVIISFQNFWAIKVSVEADKPDDEDLDLASRCVDLLEKSDPKKHFEMLSLFRDEFNKAGLEQKSKLLPSIFSQVCEIGIKMNENGDKELW